MSRHTYSVSSAFTKFHQKPARVNAYAKHSQRQKRPLLPLCSFRSVSSLHCIIYHNLQHRFVPCLASQTRSHSSVCLQCLTQDLEQQRCSRSGCRRKEERMEVGRETGRLTWRCTGFLRLQEIKEKGKKGTNIIKYTYLPAIGLPRWLSGKASTC